jgi:hypothetical protein
MELLQDCTPESVITAIGLGGGKIAEIHTRRILMVSGHILLRVPAVKEKR